MKIKTYLNQPFSFFNNKERKWLYVLSATLFAPLFLALFQPYGLSEEIASPVNPLEWILLFFLSVSTTTFIGLSLSQFLVRKWFHFENVSVKKYMIWFFFETLLLTLLSFALSFFIPDLGDDFEKELNLVFQIKVYFKAFFVLLFPFFGCILYISIKNLNYEISELEEQLRNFKNQFTITQKEELIVFKDENNNTDFKIELNDFLFAESSNQYILAYYIKEGKVSKHIVRNRLKNFLLDMENLPIVQSHRSYAINLLNVKHKIRRNGKQLLVVNTPEPFVVPVSKSFLDTINQRLS